MTHDNSFERRQSRTRYRITTNAAGRPRLSVFRSGKHIYAQVIDDRAGATLAAASTNEKEGKPAKTYNLEAASDGRQEDRRTRARQGREAGRVRSRRLHLSWAHQGARRRCPRRRPGVLSMTREEGSGA